MQTTTPASAPTRISMSITAASARDPTPAISRSSDDVLGGLDLQVLAVVGRRVAQGGHGAIVISFRP